MAETGIWKRLFDFFVSPPGVESRDLEELLGKDDSVLLEIPTLSSTYKPRSWIDRNTFFRSVFMLTEKRVLILKSGSRANVLRDIELDAVVRHSFGSAKGKGMRLEIKTVDAEDIIVFHRQYENKFGELAEKFPEALSRSLESRPESGEARFCMHCGARFSPQGAFCSSCGKKVKV